MDITKFLAPQVLAAPTPIMDIIKQGQPTDYKIPVGTTIANILTGGGLNLITLAFVVIGLLFMWNIIMAGWEYMMSSGDPKKVASATTRFLNGFTGLAIAFFAFIIVNLVTNMIGLGSLL